MDIEEVDTAMDQQNMSKVAKERLQTINDFGEQWQDLTKNEGYYATKEAFQDICGDLLDIQEIKGKNVADIGSGTGRIVNMLLDAGAAHVTALEPSAAFDVLKRNTKNREDSITYINSSGEHVPKDNFDYVFSIGVIHHIKDPLNVLQAMHDACKPASETEPAGKCLIWVYGSEGNSLYLSLVKPLWTITKRVPHAVLKAISFLLLIPLTCYIHACRFIKLPMHNYMTNVLLKWTPYTRFITIYDQLNPHTAEYYSKDEIYGFFEQAGFRNIKMYHRHGYSWTVVGERGAP